jgi:hypothetical protein
MTNHQKAGASLPANDDGPTLAEAAHQDENETSNTDCPGAHPSRQALDVIAGESRAEQYLARLQAQRADPDDLALIVSMLYGATLRGFCRVIVKALGVRHA